MLRGRGLWKLDVLVDSMQKVIPELPPFWSWDLLLPGTGTCYSCVLCVLSHFSHVRLFAAPWTVAHQAPLSMRFSRQERWSGLPSSRGSSPPRDGTCVSVSLAPAGRFFTTGTTWQAFAASQVTFAVTLAAAAAKSLQSCLTLCDPIDGSPPGSPSLGFSRQEHWSGLPFPSPMNESEK